jgi:hypothetical protein
VRRDLKKADDEIPEATYRKQPGSPTAAVPTLNETAVYFQVRMVVCEDGAVRPLLPDPRLLPAYDLVDGLRQFLKLRLCSGSGCKLAHRETAHHRFGHHDPLPDPRQNLLPHFLQ